MPGRAPCSLSTGCLPLHAEHPVCVSLCMTVSSPGCLLAATSLSTVYGCACAGKTTLLRELAHLLSDRWGHIHHCPAMSAHHFCISLLNSSRRVVKTCAN